MSPFMGAPENKFLCGAPTRRGGENGPWKQIPVFDHVVSVPEVFVPRTDPDFLQGRSWGDSLRSVTFMKGSWSFDSWRERGDASFCFYEPRSMMIGTMHRHAETEIRAWELRDGTTFRLLIVTKASERSMAEAILTSILADLDPWAMEGK